MGVAHLESKPRRPLSVVRSEARVCDQLVVDLTVGCSFGCVYCPFADLAERQHGLSRPTRTDLSDITTVPAPSTVYLSASSDPFAPQAAAHTHTLLAHWLPQGTTVGIVTKGTIPEPTIDLLARFRTQIEGVSIGLVSLDGHRNRIVEPGCPPAADRLACIARVAARGLPTILRIDPVFPGLDDDWNALTSLVAEGERRGAGGIAAGYVFAWGRYLRRMRREPMLAEACRQLTERAPMAGGVGWGVPLERKVELYTRLSELARSLGLYFQTCGCKDLRLHDYQERFSTRCTRNPFFRRPLPMSAP
jgi:DNA repair photolyase